VLADRGTWLNFKNRGDLAILVEGDTRLFNQYGVMVVNPAKHPHVKQALAQAFADWVVSPAGQASDRRLQDRRRAAVLPERPSPPRPTWKRRRSASRSCPTRLGLHRRGRPEHRHHHRRRRGAGGRHQATPGDGGAT
jgi:ABC-type Fe3+ transport system substrate-binding protein